MGKMKPGLRRNPVAFTRTLIWLGLLSYIVFLVGRSTVVNYRMNQDITRYKQQIRELEQQNESLKLALVYYRTKAYKEIEARRRLGLRGKDEKVVALPDFATEPKLAVSLVSTSAESKPVVKPYVAWWLLFFSTRD